MSGMQGDATDQREAFETLWQSLDEGRLTATSFALLISIRKGLLRSAEFLKRNKIVVQRNCCDTLMSYGFRWHSWKYGPSGRWQCVL